MQQPLSWRGWKTRPWIRRLSGVTCEPSTLARGVERFISSLPAIHANPSRPQAERGERRTLAISGQRSRGSPWKLEPSGSSARTWRDTSIWDCPRSLQTYAAWASRQKRASFLRLKSAHPTYGGASSFWPTPTAAMGGNRVDLEFSEKGLRFRIATDQKGSQVSLQTAARLWSQMWTMAALLGAQLTMLKSYPYSRPCHLTLKAGTRSPAGEWTFNPNFSDWLMGWPVGWSDPTQEATELSHWLQRMRGALSALPSPRNDGLLVVRQPAPGGVVQSDG